MEFVVYVSIGVACISVIITIPALIWKRYDDKRQEREEQDGVTA